MKRLMYLLPAILLVAGVTLAGKSGPGALDTWVSAQLTPGEILACQRKVGDDYFFVATTSSQKVKTGYRLNVTGPSGIPRTFIVSWRFQDGAGSYIGKKVQPEVISSEYRKLGSDMYVEEISYRSLYLSEVSTINVTIALKKYDQSKDAPNSIKEADKELEQVVQCSFPLVVEK